MAPTPCALPKNSEINTAAIFKLRLFSKVAVLGFIFSVLYKHCAVVIVGLRLFVVFIKPMYVDSPLLYYSFLGFVY